jgi:hypothetical protein
MGKFRSIFQNVLPSKTKDAKVFPQESFDGEALSIKDQQQVGLTGELTSSRMPERRGILSPPLDRWEKSEIADGSSVGGRCSPTITADGREFKTRKTRNQNQYSVT